MRLASSRHEVFVAVHPVRFRCTRCVRTHRRGTRCTATFTTRQPGTAARCGLQRTLRQRDREDSPTDNATRQNRRWPDIRLSTPTEVVQVIQYVRCYEYQCSHYPGWSASNASTFCALLKEALLHLLATMFKASWVCEPREPRTPNARR
jgi:hypothetical protein